MVAAAILGLLGLLLLALWVLNLWGIGRDPVIDIDFQRMCIKRREALDRERRRVR